MEEIIKRWRHTLTNDYTVASLKIMIIAVALFVIGLALFVDDKWILAGILLYEVLP